MKHYTKWQKVESAHPIFRLMRYSPQTRRRGDAPYIMVEGTIYRVRRVVDDHTAWVTEVTSPLERVATSTLAYMHDWGDQRWHQEDDGRWGGRISSRRRAASATPISPPRVIQGR